MAIDEDSNWLATGDVDGLVKVWDISLYCLYDSADIITDAPRMSQQHTDVQILYVYGLRIGGPQERMVSLKRA